LATARVGGDQGVTESGGNLGRSAHQQRRTPEPQRPGRDPQPPAAVLELLARPGRSQHRDAFPDERDAVVEGVAVHRQLLRSMASSFFASGRSFAFGSGLRGDQTSASEFSSTAGATDRAVVPSPMVLP
jgi:hypothetical protein